MSEATKEIIKRKGTEIRSQEQKFAKQLQIIEANDKLVDILRDCDTLREYIYQKIKEVEILLSNPPKDYTKLLGQVTSGIEDSYNIDN